MKLFLNGTLTDAAEATVSVFDYGFTMGVTVTEQIRTYNRQTPLLKWHLDRFYGGLETIGLKIDFTRSEIETQIDHLIQTNGRLLSADDELGIGVCATPGLMASGGYSIALGLANDGPTVLVYTYPLCRERLIETLETGVRLTLVSTQEISAASIPKTLKCRSRMHYYLAEAEAQAIDPGSRALLCDAEGFIAEGTTASIAMIQSKTLVVPLKETVLTGVTLAVMLKLASAMDVAIDRRNITRSELENADEAMWLTTPAGIVAVTGVNRHRIGDGNAGPMTRQLTAAWEAEVYRR